MGETHNPYAPPSTEADYDPAGSALHTPGNLPLASRGKRWLGYLFDHLVAAMAAIPGVALAMTSGKEESGLALGLAGFLVISAIQAYLIATTGQSVAKRILNVKVVRQDGSPPGFVYGVLLRSWLVFVIQIVPGLGNIFGFIDGVMVFRADQRCLHDLIAGTSVVQVVPGGATWAPSAR
jgi:uncharacterized RDD family membrane protein YckC